MYKIKETDKSLRVVFSKNDMLRDAPHKKFKKADFASAKYVKKAAKEYADGFIDFSNSTKQLAKVIKSIPSLAKDKISFHTSNIKNRTGVVGVYLEHSYDECGDRTPYSYTANYVINGKRVQRRFPFSKFDSQDAAFRAAVSTRLLAININKVLLD